MLELLEKKVTDISDDEFDKRFSQVEDPYKNDFKDLLTEIRLKKNNEFAIKEVFDDASFEENAKVVKEVVELLQVYQIRYNYRQQFLSDFFELLLTTGLKQESGQFFTPLPIARFIIKSLPLQEITAKKIEQGNKNDLLPTIIDYAAGSGHFLTESMEEVQKYIDSLGESNVNPTTIRAIKKWKDDQFDWAEDYVYGIEKDYRLVKTAKVSCYLHGDGLAKVIHGDGLGDFETSKEFKDLLTETDKFYPQDNKKFDVVISNPPYSVSAFKGLMDGKKSKLGFDLYSRLTDQSSEIECLFIERTKQLLKDGGMAGIILPSSILSNTGIYTQTREILLKYFEILGVAELGSNTFMATGTNTVILFLKRRNNADAINIEEAVKKVFVNLQDVTINGIEKPLAKYVAHVWDTISFDDYKTLLQKAPNKNIEQHEIYKEYTKKIKAKNEQELWTNILAIEQDKLLYFILAYPQKLVLVKTGSKNEEKRFLGYEFSNRRGSEGIHPIQRSKSIDECTQLYDADSFINPEKASYYIYKAFLGEFDLDITENLKQNVSYQNLVDMLTFDRVHFEKTISLSAKKKVKIESKWDIKKLGDLVEILDDRRIPVSKRDRNAGDYPYYGATGVIDYIDKYIFKEKLILIGEDGAKWGLNEKSAFIVDGKYWVNNHAHVLKPNRDIILDGFVTEILNKFDLSPYITGLNVPKLNQENLKEIQLPLPPLDIQQKIVSEIEKLEKQEQKAVEGIEKLKKEIHNLYLTNKWKSKRFDEIADIIRGVTYSKSDQSNFETNKIILTADNITLNGNFEINKTVYLYEDYQISDKKKLRKNDIFICLSSGSKRHLGKVAFMEKDTIYYAGGFMGIIRVKNNNESKYLYQLLNTLLRETIRDVGSGSNINNLSGVINEIKIPLPPLDIQKKIVAQITKIENKISILQKEISVIPKLKEEILKKYL